MTASDRFKAILLLETPIMDLIVIVSMPTVHSFHLFVSLWKWPNKIMWSTALKWSNVRGEISEIQKNFACNITIGDRMLPSRLWCCMKAFGGFLTRLHFLVRNLSRPWRWDRQIVPKRKFQTTKWRRVKNPKAFIQQYSRFWSLWIPDVRDVEDTVSCLVICVLQ
jgi:hypothetical protein